MYRTYFGIDENPFSITPDPRYLYMSEKHQEALAHLLFGVGEGRGFVLLTGEVGTGKTTISRCLLDRLPANVDIALCINPRMSEAELLANICDELGIPYQREAPNLKHLVDALNQHLLEAHAKGRRSVLVIDEAQNLSPAVLEQVRLLTNLETETHKLLQIILIGQPELNDLLARHELRQLAQRITARYHLNSLTRRETAGFVRHRLAVGGLDGELFDSAALSEVHRFSGGTPRLINSIADRCLLAAFARNRRGIDRRLVRAAAAEVLGEGMPRRRPRERLLPWASAAALGAAAAALFVAVGPFDLGSVSLFARTQAIIAPTQAVTRAQPIEAGAELQAAPIPPAERGVAVELATKPASAPGSTDAATRSKEETTGSGQDTPPPHMVALGERQTPQISSATLVAAREPLPVPPQSAVADLAVEPVANPATDNARAAATSATFVEAEPPFPTAMANTPVLGSEPERAPSPADIAKVQPPPLVRPLAPATVEATVSPRRPIAPKDGLTTTSANPAMTVAKVDPETAITIPEPDKPATVETLFRHPEVRGDLETALAACRT